MAAAMAAKCRGCGSKTADTQTTAQETPPQSASGGIFLSNNIR